MERTCELEGNYRYLLRIRVSEARKTALFILCNPSTADATKDDITTRNLKKWAKQNDIGTVVVANLYAYRTSQPGELSSLSEADVVGAKNMDAITRAAAEVDEVIVAWGNLPAIRGDEEFERRVGQVLAAIGKVHREVHCVGTTRKGHPRHPRRWYMESERPKTLFTKNDQPHVETGRLK